MFRKLLMFPLFFLAFVVTLFAIVKVLDLKIIPDREGDIIYTSSDINELLDVVSFLSFLDGNVEECEWHMQVVERSGRVFFMYEYCRTGEATLKSDYFDFITTKYEWKIYDYEQHRTLNENDFVIASMYRASIIRDSLETKQLYVCDDPMFSDGIRFTFLDKANKTLYFYCHSF